MNQYHSKINKGITVLGHRHTTNSYQAVSEQKNVKLNIKLLSELSSRVDYRNYEKYDYQHLLSIECLLSIFGIGKAEEENIDGITQ